jgi:predicted DNA-binding transcriptional regulator AlpA
MPTVNTVSRPRRELIDGCPHINRAEIMKRTGMSEQAQANLYSQRSENGHPEGKRVGRSLLFPEEPVLEWHEQWLAHKRAGLTQADRSGDPNELLDTAGATKLLGYTTTSTIRGYLAANDGYFPDADETEELPSGRIRRRWKRSTLWAFADRRSRSGRGGQAPGP